MKAKKLLLASIFSIVTGWFGTAAADMYHKEDVIKVNGIQMVEHVAYKFVDYAMENEIEVTDKHGKAVNIDSSLEDEIYIAPCDLMDAVSALYVEAISDAEKGIGRVVVCKAKRMGNGEKVVVYINKETLCIVGSMMS